MEMSLKPKTLRELAARVLKHPRGGLEALLELVGGSETEWLELKAATCPKEGDFQKGENEDDYRWDVARAVIALANSIGGVVLLGVNDKGMPIGLEASDPTHKRERKGAEAFRREVILEKVLHPKGGWRTGRQGGLKVVNPSLLEQLVTLEEVRCSEKFALAILVDPAPLGYGHVVVEKTTMGRTARVVYARKRGAVGQITELPVEDPAVLQVRNGRHMRQEQEAGLVWDKFLTCVQVARPAQELVPHIQRYLGRIKNQLSQLEEVFTPLDAEQREIAVVEPGVSKGDIAPGFDEGWLGEPSQRDHPVGDDAVELLTPDHALRQGLVTDLLDEQRRAVLIGEAGSGKSTCFGNLALRAAEQWAPGRPWPLLASLAEYSSDGLAGLLQRRSGIEWQDLAPQVAAGDVILYLDALNECPDSLFDSCRIEIVSLLHEYRDARVFVSARSSNAPEEFKLATFKIRSMGRPQQLRFLGALLGEANRAAELLDRLYGQPGGETIAGSPVLLRIVAEVARETSEIPAGRAALYRRFLETWHRRESMKDGLSGGEFPWGREQVIDALSVLAFRARQKGWGTCHLHQARDILVPVLGEDVDRFIDRIAQGLILTRDEETNTVGFWHETIQEYLCAEYLAARHRDLGPNALGGTAVAKLATWAMPVAFALELVADPSHALMNAAWQVEPLLVAAAARDAGLLATLQIEGDAWTRGVLRALLGEDVTAEARAITIEARLPPKYPFSPYLVSTLRGSAFWYAAQTHEAGAIRLDRLRRLLCGRHFPWIELLPAALVGNDAWRSDLGPAMRAVVGVPPAASLSEVLSTATVSELCALRRRGGISAETFLSCLEHPLGETSDPQLEMDLVDILRSERESVREIVRKMLPLYRTQLRDIAAEPDLSLRVLCVLVRWGAISAQDIRREAGRLDAILSRMSMMNAIRLAKSRVLRRADLDEQERTRLVYASSPKEIRMALEAGLLLGEDLPPDLLKQVAPRPTAGEIYARTNAGRRSYLVADLAAHDARRGVDEQLRNKRWNVIVKSVRPESNFGFARHSDFDRDIFFILSNISSPGGLPISPGQTLDVRLVTRFDRKKEQWGFAVDSGRVVDQAP
jgi:Putative DNA-binding domain